MIKINNLYKTYTMGDNQVNALQDINLHILPHQFVSIIGPSGSGKSTLMNMIGCLDTPTSGEYYLDGKKVSAMTENELAVVRNKKIGFIFQGFNLLPKLTALENVELPLIYMGIPKDERQKMSERALEKVGLASRSKHTPKQLSGGQQQRVAIARALAANPPIILADEPTGNLDSKSTREIMQMLKDLHKEGNTIVLITHDSDIARQAERVVRISDGMITRDDAADDKVVCE